MKKAINIVFKSAQKSRDPQRALKVVYVDSNDLKF